MGRAEIRVAEDPAGIGEDVGEAFTVRSGWHGPLDSVVQRYFLGDQVPEEIGLGQQFDPGKRALGLQRDAGQDFSPQ